MLPEFIQHRTPPPHTVTLHLAKPELPWVAEYPHFCWGTVEYESRGDCVRPTDRGWSWLEVRARGGGERILAFRSEEAERPPGFLHSLRLEATSARALWMSAILTMRRVPSLAWLRRRGHMVGHAALAEHFLPQEDLNAFWERAEPVRRQYAAEALKPFDTMAWWGGWKWEGRFSSPGSKSKREVMNALLTGDRAALPGIFEDLAAGVEPGQRDGYFHALRTLTGESLASEADWIEWWRRERR